MSDIEVKRIKKEFIKKSILIMRKVNSTNCVEYAKKMYALKAEYFPQLKWDVYEHVGSNYCPFCKVYFDKNCEGCPLDSGRGKICNACEQGGCDGCDVLGDGYSVCCDEFNNLLRAEDNKEIEKAFNALKARIDSIEE